MLTAISLSFICQRNEIFVSNMPKKLTKQEFIERANKIHKGRYDYSKVKYVNSKTKVCIICQKHGEFWQTPHAHITLKQGCWECYLDSQKRGICNIGINDVRNSNSTVAYGVWNDLVARCCDAKYKQKYRCYKDCTICKEWLTFSVFKDWFDKHYVDGWQLDKDMLVKGNQIYSPETCCFLPRELNNIYKRTLSGRTLPQCCRLTDSGKYSVVVRTQKKRIHLGTFNSIEDAFMAYKAKKEEIVRDTARRYESQLEERVLNALLNFEIDYNYGGNKSNE